MSTIPEQYIDAHKEFRKFLRTAKGENGTYLSNLMDAASTHLSNIVRSGIDPSFSILYDDTISLDKLVYYAVSIANHGGWLTKRNGHTSLKCLRYFIAYRADREGVDVAPLFSKYEKEAEAKKAEEVRRQARELASKQEFTEGNIVDSHYDRRERNHSARLACIERYGCKCAICEFDFEATYGEAGKDFIEVHHIVPLASTDGEHEVNPEGDLIPVCSNCHSILHRRRPIPYRPEDVMQMLK